jgi:hypothetical protein
MTPKTPLVKMGDWGRDPHAWWEAEDEEESIFFIKISS